MEGIEQVLFDIDNKIGLDTEEAKAKQKKIAKDNAKEMDLFEDSDDPDYEVLSDNIRGVRNVHKIEMPKKQFP